MHVDPISVAIVNDYPVIVEGVSNLLGRDQRLAVVELDSMVEPSRPVDVVLVDTFAAEDHEEEMGKLIRDPRFGRVVIYSWNLDPRIIDHALKLGAGGYLSKALGADELIEGLVRCHEGEQVVDPRPVSDVADIRAPDWPGRSEGLSARESEVVALISQGLTNEEIARTCYLSINSVKSYIRSAYRKMGVERRSQAVIWGMEHGMRLQPTRTVVQNEAG